MKTIEEWREEINGLFVKSANETAKLLAHMQSEILIAFCAKYSIMPDQATLCYQANKIWVERLNKWVSVKERLPSENNRYMVVFDDLEPEHCIGFSSFSTETQEFNHTDITHWMPLPELPNE